MIITTIQTESLSKFEECVQGGALEWLASALQPGLQNVCQWLPRRPRCQGTHSGFLWGVSEGRGRPSASGAYVPAQEEGGLHHEIACKPLPNVIDKEYSDSTVTTVTCVPAMMGTH